MSACMPTSPSRPGQPAARKRAITEFLATARNCRGSIPIRQPGLALDCQHANGEPPGDVLDGYDFPITPTDARQYAAAKLLAALDRPDTRPRKRNRSASNISGNDEGWLSPTKLPLPMPRSPTPPGSITDKFRRSPMTPLKKPVTRRSDELYRGLKIPPHCRHPAPGGFYRASARKMPSRGNHFDPRRLRNCRPDPGHPRPERAPKKKKSASGARVYNVLTVDAADQH